MKSGLVEITKTGSVASFHASREVGGKEVAGEDKESFFVVRGTVVIFKRGTEVSQVGTIKLVEATGNPKKMDLIITDSPHEGKTVLAIYDVGKEMFQYCGSLDERPTSFTTKKDDKNYVYCTTYKRLKR